MKPKAEESSDDDEPSLRIQSSSIISSRLNHIQMDSDITNSHISAKSKSTHLSSTRVPSHKPLGVADQEPINRVNQQQQPSFEQPKPRAMGRGARRIENVIRPLSAFSMANQKIRNGHQQETGGLRKTPLGHVILTEETNTQLPQTIEDRAVEQFEEYVKPVAKPTSSSSPAFYVFDSKIRNMDGIITQSLNGPGLFIFQSEKLANDPYIQNMYRLMENLYSSVHALNDGAFTRYRKVEDIQLAQFCVYRHKERFERARVVDKNDKSVTLFLIDEGIVVDNVSPDMVASFPDERYTGVHLDKTNLMSTNPPCAFPCRLSKASPLKPSASNNRFAGQSIAKFNELVDLGNPPEERRFVRILPDFPKDDEVTSYGHVIPVVVSCQSTTKFNQKNALQELGECIKRSSGNELVKSIIQLTEQENVIVGTEDLDKNRKQKYAHTVGHFNDSNKDFPKLKPKINIKKGSNILRDANRKVEV